MKNKLFISFALIVSAFVFSACTLKDKAELNILNKVDNKIDQEIEEKSPTVKTETGSESEADLLKEIDSTTDAGSDSDFKSLETELNN